MDIIKVNNLTKNYKNGVQALKGISLTVKEGEVFTLLGKNGAGKSTLINILTTFLLPTGGNVRILNKDMYNEAFEIRKGISCVSQKPSIDSYLSLEENFMFQSKIYRVPIKEAKSRMKELIKTFELENYTKYPVATYSGGVKRRLDIALSLISNPKIIFLDEPTVGLDIQSRRAMWNMIKKVKEEFGTTIFLTTHYLEEADQLSDTICIMRDGKNVIQGTHKELRKFLKEEKIEIEFSKRVDANRGFHILKEINLLPDGYIEDSKIIASYDQGGIQIESITKELLDKNILFRGINIVEPTLEDVFMKYTRDVEMEVM